MVLLLIFVPELVLGTTALSPLQSPNVLVIESLNLSALRPLRLAPGEL